MPRDSVLSTPCVHRRASRPVAASPSLLQVPFSSDKKWMAVRCTRTPNKPGFVATDTIFGRDVGENVPHCHSRVISWRVHWHRR